MYDKRKTKLDRNLMLTAANGKQMRAFEVFGAAINFLKNHFLEKINNQNIPANRISVNDVLWVLTIPAIWDDSAKQFMRESACQVNNLIYIFIYFFDMVLFE